MSDMKLGLIVWEFGVSCSAWPVSISYRLLYCKGVFVNLSVNGKSVSANVPGDMPLLWVLRDEMNLTGTKFGCGLAQCGACTVHIDGQPVRSCVTPVSTVVGKAITTIEGLSANGDHALQKAWIAEQAPQCGYCQSGQIMQAAALLAKNKSPTRAQIVEHMAGNICRCGTYNQIVAAVERAARSA
jgi:isoquinoline 1-oxidoreductase subunit alpha